MKYLLPVLFLISLQLQAQDWEETAILSPNEENLLMGVSVAIKNDIAATGATGDDFDADGNNPINNAGAVYVYEKDVNGVWNQTQKLVASDRAASDLFGTSIAINDEFIFVGSKSYTDSNGNNPIFENGAVYVFKKNASGVFEQTQKIVQSDRFMPSASQAAFGLEEIAVDNNTLVVGARSEEDNSVPFPPMQAGAVYIFEKNSSDLWVETQKITSPIREISDFYGFSVDVSGDYMVVGAPGDRQDAMEQNPLISAGSIYVYKRNSGNTWDLEKKITSTNRLEFDNFGSSLALDGDYVVVSMKDSSYGNGAGELPGAGIAYIFKRDASGNWPETQVLLASNRAEGGGFGSDVDISGDTLIIGAESEDNGNADDDFDSGAAYMYKLNSSDVWADEVIFRSATSSNEDSLGNDVSLDDNRMMVGAYLKDVNGFNNSGAAFVYESEEILSTTDFLLNSNIKLYPNPTHSAIKIELPETSDVEVVITNSLGQEIVSKTYKNGNYYELLLPGSTGIYFVNIKTTSGNFSSFKVLKL